MRKTTCKLVCMLVVCFLCVGLIGVSPIQAAHVDDDMRAVWISTVFNLDYPSVKNNITAQQNEFIEKLDTLKALGMNAVVVQVRPKADALYNSSINPWSDVLTGTQGKDPGYDPMQFMIDEAHKRGMAFHAWLNPYRVTTSGTDVSALCMTHPARVNPAMTLVSGGKLYYNPESEEVKQHIVATVKEIATNYNVDGIHFDDYFYPSGYPLPAGETRDGSTANKRRQAVNDMVQRVSYAIKNVNATYGKNVKFGISPPGIWKNSTSDVTGSKTSGSEAYYSVYADSRTWIQNEWIDYIVPQIYWKTGHAKADYETLVSWWSNEVKGTNVKLYIGQGVYNEEVAKQIGTQLSINKNYPAVKGSIFFSLRNIISDLQGCKRQIATFYNGTTSNVGSSNNVENGQMSPLPNTTVPPTSNNNNTINNMATASAIGKKAKVTATTLNIRSGARVDRPLITKVGAGTTVTILDVFGEWYKVKLPNNTVGFASAAYLSVLNKTGNSDTGSNTPAVSGNGQSTVDSPLNSGISFPCAGTVTASTLNVRSGARVDRELIAKLPKGTKVTVLAILNNWLKIKMANGQVGWVSSEFIAL